MKITAAYSSVRSNPALRCALLVIALLCPASRAAATTIYVNPSGNDKWSGRLEQANDQKTDGPVASLVAARDALRKLGNDTPKTVVVAAGRYEMSETLVLTPQDGGTAKCPVVYRAANGAKPLFSGGRRITGFKRGSDGIWRTKISPKMRFEQLFVNGKRATRAKTPNGSWMSFLDVKEVKLKAPKARTTHRQTVKLRAEDIKPLLNMKPAELRDVSMMIFHKWDNTRRFVGSIDAASGSIITDGKNMKSWNSWRKGTRFHLENYIGALDAPGEWFLGRDGVLAYKPLDKQDMSTVEVVAPVLEKFIIFCASLSAPPRLKAVIRRTMNT